MAITKIEGLELFYLSGKTLCRMALRGEGISSFGYGEPTSPWDYHHGLTEPASVAFVGVFDPDSPGHVDLIERLQPAKSTQWIICFRDGASKPTVVDGKLTAPKKRSSLLFKAKLQYADLGFDENAKTYVVRMELETRGKVQAQARK